MFFWLALKLDTSFIWYFSWLFKKLHELLLNKKTQYFWADEK